MAKKALAAGYAVIAVGNLKGTKGCWEREDIPSVAKELAKWRSKRKLPARDAGGVPLYALGVGSGGWFAAQAAKSWPDVRAITVQSSVPTLSQIIPKASETTTPRNFPPLQMVLMRKDTAKAAAGQRLVSGAEQDWPGRLRSEILTTLPKPVPSLLLSDKIPGLAQNLSEAVHMALRKAGRIDDQDMLTKQPLRTELRELISDAIGMRKTDFPQRSKQLAIDAILAELDLAYAFEASTCEYMKDTLSFWRRNAGNASVVTVPANMHTHGGNHSKSNSSHHHNGTSHHHYDHHHSSTGSKTSSSKHSDSKHSTKSSGHSTKSSGHSTKSSGHKKSGKGTTELPSEGAPSPPSKSFSLFSLFG